MRWRRSASRSAASAARRSDLSTCTVKINSALTRSNAHARARPKRPETNPDTGAACALIPITQVRIPARPAPTDTRSPGSIVAIAAVTAVASANPCLATEPPRIAPIARCGHRRAPCRNRIAAHTPAGSHASGARGPMSASSTAPTADNAPSKMVAVGVVSVQQSAADHNNSVRTFRRHGVEPGAPPRGMRRAARRAARRARASAPASRWRVVRSATAY